MKSIVSKKTDFTLIKRAAALFAVLFVVALLLVTEHFVEDAVTPEEVHGAAPRQNVGSEPGALAPGFTVPDLNGRRVSLADYRGQVVVINLWATWCAPCRIEMPSIEKMHRRFRSAGLTVLAVSLDKGRDEEVRKFVEERQLSFPVLIDNEQQVEGLYQTISIPTTYVIDRQGRVAARVDGAKNWESEETFKALQLLLDMG
ncbi:MAG: TlpA disulfide reductase family protein [Nitrospinaceae bacterium]